MGLILPEPTVDVTEVWGLFSDGCPSVAFMSYINITEESKVSNF
jgi:hypothetical protein